MDSLNSIELLKEALLALSNELEKTKQESESRLEILKKIFPYDLYKIVRPDVARKLGADEPALLEHFLKHGDREIDIKQAMRENINSGSEGIKTRCLRDSKLFSLSDKKTSGDQVNRRLLKIINTKENINSNTAHVFASKHTLMHLNSNTVATWIPKIACSNMRYSFAYANGAVSSAKDIGWIHRNNAEFNASNKELLLADYTFVVLRNPFKRLLSFFMDKICHAEENPEDPSYAHAKKVFEAGNIDSFHDFIDFIWKNPCSIELDEHTRQQCDFLIYEKYDDYFSIENYKATAKHIEEKTGITLHDVRNFNSIFTTHNCIDSDSFSPETTLPLIKEYLSQGKKPIAENMYTEEMIKKVATLYLPDILLYCNVLEGGVEEMKDWIHRSI